MESENYVKRINSLKGNERFVRFDQEKQIQGF